VKSLELLKFIEVFKNYNVIQKSHHPSIQSSLEVIRINQSELLHINCVQDWMAFRSSAICVGVKCEECLFQIGSRYKRSRVHLKLPYCSVCSDTCNKIIELFPNIKTPPNLFDLIEDFLNTVQRRKS